LDGKGDCSLLHEMNLVVGRWWEGFGEGAGLARGVQIFCGLVAASLRPAPPILARLLCSICSERAWHLLPPPAPTSRASPERASPGPAFPVLTT
jgi:hypothetical protein